MAELITVQTFVRADQKKVWDYFTQPEHITKWNFADAGWHCPAAENDLTVGGKFNYRMEAKDGSFGFDFGGTYTDISPLNQIKYVMNDGRTCEVIFRRIKDDKIEVIENFQAESQNPVEMQKQGWQMILDNFKKYTEEN